MCIAVALTLRALTTRSEESLSFHPYAGPEPVAVLLGRNPWTPFIPGGGYIPELVVYADRSIIFKRQSAARESVRTKKLTEKEFVSFVQSIRPLIDFKDLRRDYNLAPGITDQGVTQLYLKLEGRVTLVTIYGAIDAGHSAPYTRRGNEKPDVLPDLLKQTLTNLFSVDYRKTDRWRPRYLEVDLSPYEYAPYDSIYWPKHWPGLDSPRTIKSGAGYLIFMDGDQEKPLEKFLRTRKEKGAVVIDRKKWAVYSRPVIPSEPLWRKAFVGDDAKSP
jgi:hypothetical protein